VIFKCALVVMGDLLAEAELTTRNSCCQDSDFQEMVFDLDSWGFAGLRFDGK